MLKRPQKNIEPLHPASKHTSPAENTSKAAMIMRTDEAQELSFGELLAARETQSRKRKRGSDIPLKASSPVPSDDDSDSAPFETPARIPHRSSKHAPMEQSSKYPVTRKRQVIHVPKQVNQDPRFVLPESSYHPDKSGKNYAFLWDYRKEETKELRAALKQKHTEEEEINLRRKLNSMENQVKAKEAKEREQEVRRRHRKEEKGRIEEGKRPFYLKEKDVRETAVAERFSALKKKDQTKAIERRRRKEGQKEKRKMPRARRMVD